MNRMVPTWRRLRRYGSSRFIRSSYLWVVAVPITAKLVPQLEAMLSIVGSEITLSLPFSWQMFYFGSVFFAISSFIYSMKCPHLIQNYRTPNDYWKDGHGLRELDAYAEETFAALDESIREKIITEYKEVKATLIGNVVSDTEGDRNSRFLYIQENTQYKRNLSRCLCSAGYLIGSLFFLFVLFRNFIYVFKQLVST